MNTKPSVEELFKSHPEYFIIKRVTVGGNTIRFSYRMRLRYVIIQFLKEWGMDE